MNISKIKTLRKSKVLNFLSRNFFFVFFLIFLLGSVVFWRINNPFFYWDEWDWLKQIADGSFNILEPHNEHFLPIVKIIYLFDVKVLNADPIIMHYIMLIFHSTVSLVFSFLIYLLFKRKLFSFIAGLLFLIHPFQWESVLWLFTIQIILNVLLFLLSLVCMKLFFDKQRKLFFFLSLLLSFLQIYCFGFGIILPLVNIVFFYIFKNKRYSFLYYASYLSIFIINLCTYFFFSSQAITSHTGGYTFSDVIPISVYFFSAVMLNVSRFVTMFGNPIGGYKTLLSIVISVIMLVVILIILKKARNRQRLLFKVVLFSIFFYAIIFGFISLSRFRLGISASFSFRYGYYFLIPIILSVVATLEYFRGSIKGNILNWGGGLLFLFFIIFMIIKGNVYKTRFNDVNLANKQELVRYYYDRAYDPDLSKMHPFQADEELFNSCVELSIIDNINKD